MSVPAPLHRSVLATVPREFATGSVPGTNMCQRQSNDPDVQEEKSFDWSGPESKGPPTVASSELRVTTESDLKEALNRDATTSEMNNHSEAALSPQEDLK